MCLLDLARTKESQTKLYKKGPIFGLPILKISEKLTYKNLFSMCQFVTPRLIKIVELKLPSKLKPKVELLFEKPVYKTQIISLLQN